MTDDGLSNIFLGIGVADPRGMTRLPGVRTSIDQMADWAHKQQYDSIVRVCDDTEPVTAQRIKDHLGPLLDQPLNRIVVYFVGHGFSDALDQLWILSDGPEVNTGRISRNALRASLETYGPVQIAMISDACLTARGFPSGATPVLDDRSGSRKNVFVDNIYSTLPNEPSYFFRAEEKKSEFCLFTSVLLEFLNGRHPNAFRLADGECPDVTTQTLLWNLPEAVEDRAAGLQVDQRPKIFPGFPYGRDIYSRFPDRSGSDGTVTPPPFSNRRPHTEPGPDDPKKLEERLIGSQPSAPPLLSRQRMEKVFTELNRWNGRLAALVHHSGKNSNWGMIVNERPTGFITGPLTEDGGNSWWMPITKSDLDRVVPYRGREKRLFLTLSWYIEQNTEFFTMVPVFDDLVATVHIQNESEGTEGVLKSGCYQLSWTPEYKLPYDADFSYSAKTILSWRYLLALNDGKLNSGDAHLIAHSMRDEKHINPMIGVVCAYLYDLVGDVHSIARMCHFYWQHSQAIPFDIALLSGGEIRRVSDGYGWEVIYPEAPDDEPMEPDYLWRATPRGVAPVAGVAPLLRSGWNRLTALASPDRDLLEGFAALTSSLSRAPIATLAGREAVEEAKRLLEILNIL